MPEPMTWKARFERLINAGVEVDKLIRGGVTVPMGGSSLNLSVPNYEDPRLSFRVPGTPKRPRLTFDLTLDLDWHKRLGI